ncbi:putative secreted protein with C-terminal beta-propeller domain [Saccharothrix tamanrassetensis]|uniref:Putative secreted protein with C-terminal beta-propeller domain n=1 Tax=Saccharothrix tamanrassetensis TaxID=1051531 RepID=A0A841CG57_9PSEU|nr:beta-propeller domain-containing protein [Saccharothrix tamanrassetensis]MBB5955980.1 putative secreted protein with C-terminal beta-propeller domain [Saccharothrix tamanrassetensis]
MTRWSWGRRAALLGGAALVAVVGAASAAPTVFDVREQPPVRNVPVELVAYDTCDAALAEMRAAVAPHVGVYGLGDQGYLTVENGRATAGTPKAAPSADRAAPEHSGTNVHEAGVDEPDLVKTDGRRVVTVADGKLRVVDVASRELTGTLDLPAGFASQLLLHGDRALVIAGSSMMLERGLVPGDFAPEGATLTLVDLKGAPKVVGSLKVDGRYLDARQIGDVVRVVVHSGPRLPWVYPADGVSEAEALIRNREVVATAPIESWLPHYELTGEDGSRTAGSLVACDRVSHPRQHSATSMLSVLTFDFPGELGTGDAVSIVADGDTVYGTENSLYIADDHHLVPNVRRMPAPPTTTAIHQFDISQAGPPRHVASGQVTGSPLNQYALSEHRGHLRVATTAFDAPGVPEQPPASQSAVTVLKRDGAKLVEVGKVDGLGVGERIYSVRFVGPVGYVVTFRQTDPLYTLDLSDPAKPRKVGELKINGYSAYLHPAGDGKLIGVGQEATDQGRTQGTQVSLFDVANAAAPTRIADHHVPGASSEVEYDAHAFLYWPARDLLVVPVMTYPTAEKPTSPPSGGVLVLRLRDNTFTSLGTVRHTSAPDHDPGVRRALVVGEDLWTVSAAGAQVTRIDGLAQQAWVPFS